MRAVAIVTQNAAHGPAIDVAINAILPGIDLEGQQCFARLDHHPRPLVHFFRPGLQGRALSREPGPGRHDRLDKTGTLTFGRPEVQTIVPTEGVSPEAVLGESASNRDLARDCS
jgi:hypothetical protein